MISLYPHQKSPLNWPSYDLTCIIYILIISYNIYISPWKHGKLNPNHDIPMSFRLWIQIPISTQISLRLKLETPKDLATKSTKANIRSWAAQCRRNLQGLRVQMSWWIDVSSNISNWEIPEENGGVKLETSSINKECSIMCYCHYHSCDTVIQCTWKMSSECNKLSSQIAIGPLVSIGHIMATSSPLLHGNFWRSQGRRFFMKVCLATSKTTFFWAYLLWLSRMAVKKIQQGKPSRI